MLITFYIAAVVAILATLRVITGANAVHSLLCLVVSLLAVAAIFFALGAPFAGALEVIVYAGAIMVLFVFVVMMLNLDDSVVQQERDWLRPGVWVIPALLSSVLLLELCRVLLLAPPELSGLSVVDAKQVGIELYGAYLLVVELASMLLLAALVVAYHLGRNDSNTGT